MTDAHDSGKSRLWIVAMLPITVLALFLFFALLPALSDPRFHQHRDLGRALVITSAVTGLYGIAEISLCTIRRRTLLHPAIVFLLLILGVATSVFLYPMSKQSADTKIIPELRLSSPLPSP
jgi:hypothetical protein